MLQIVGYCTVDLKQIQCGERSDNTLRRCSVPELIYDGSQGNATPRNVVFIIAPIDVLRTHTVRPIRSSNPGIPGCCGSCRVCRGGAPWSLRAKEGSAP